MNLLVYNVKNDKRAAAVEMAFMLPLLLMILFGIITFGFIFHDYLEITHAAREGVRWAALENNYDFVLASAQAAAPGIDWNKAMLTMDKNGIPTQQATISDQGDPITVSITYELPAVVSELGLSINKIAQIFSGSSSGPFPTRIRSAATQRVE